MVKKYKEEGYSLLEISVAVGLAMIILAVGLPSFNNALEFSDENKGKTALISAGTILENERLRNNGIYPSTVPTKITQNNDMKEIEVTYGNKRMSYCLVLETPRGARLYMTNKDTEPIKIADSSNPCPSASLKP